MEAQQCAREPTGTNGPTLNNNPTHRSGDKKHQHNSRNHYTNHDQPTPPPHKTAWGSVLNTKTCGGHSTGETPSNIPNLEAKPGSADGTATDGLWESRTPPQHTDGSGQRLHSLWPLLRLLNAISADVTLRSAFTGQTERPGSPRGCTPDVQ